MKKLVLAEKPSVARDYAKALGCDKRQDGYYEGKDYVITWAFGHLFTLKEPGDYDEAYKQWKLDVLPIVPKPFGIKLIDEPHVQRQFKIIQEQLQRDDVDGVVIGTDAGREGELIARYILGAAKNRKPVFRLWLSSLTEQDILEGFQNLEPGERYIPVFQAAQARNELDWILGLNFTRAFTVKHGRKTLLSIGRCQTPVLNMIVERDREIEQFKPEAYWELVAEFSKRNENYKGKYLAGEDSFRIPDQDIADRVLANIQGQNGEVVEVRKETKKRPHPLLFNLTNLQRTLNRKYGYSAQEVLDTMQDLYEKHKILSYPRTAARHISEAMVPELPAIIRTLAFGKFKRFANVLLAKDELPVTKRIADDSMLTDHTAIIPVNNSRLANIYEGLSEQERNAFDEVALAFLAAFYSDYIYESTAVVTNVGEYAFLTRGIRVVDDGWRQVYQEPAEEDEEEDTGESLLPALEPGQAVSVKNAALETKKTKPPSRFTENSLLKLMENPSGLIEEESLKKAIKGHGIGTEATRASIIEVLVKRGFVERKKKQLISTPLGRQLVDAVSIDLLKSPELTAEWEQNLEKIAAGEMSKEDFMADTIRFIREGIKTVKEKEPVPILAPVKDAVGPCPYCDTGQVVKNKAGWGCNQWRTTGCKFFVSAEFMGKKITDAQIKKLVSKGKSNLIKGFKNKAGKVFDAYLVVEKEKKRVKLEFKE